MVLTEAIAEAPIDIPEWIFTAQAVTLIEGKAYIWYQSVAAINIHHNKPKC